jgi:hypothetical protein
VNGLYIKNVNYSQINVSCEYSAFDKFYKVNGYLFKEKRLCLPNYSMRELLSS